MAPATTQPNNMTTATTPMTPSNTTQFVLKNQCPNPMIVDTLYYPLVLIPAVLVVLTFALTQRRRNMFLDVLNGRPGIIHPMDMLTKSDRVCYMCALGATANLLYRCIFENLRAIDYDGPVVMQTVLILTSVVIFGFAYFPVFCCLTAGSLLSFGLGSVYVWMLTTVEIVRMADCDDYDPAFRTIIIFKGLPNFLCLIYLSVRIPLKFYQDFSHGEGFMSNLWEKRRERYSFEDFRNSSVGQHVRALLRKPEEEEPRVGICANVSGCLMDWTYRPVPGFRYSARFLATHFLAILLLYSAGFTFYSIVVGLRNAFNMIISKLDTVGVTHEMQQEMVDLLEYVIVTLGSAITLAIVLGLFGILRMFITYRDTMFALNKGRLKHLWVDKSSDYLLLCAIKYSGYQVISVVWGFVIHFLVILIPCGLIAAATWAIKHGHTQWAVGLVKGYWPVVFWSLIIYIAQVLVTKFAFVVDKKHLVLDNRRALFVFTYFILFYNIFLGIFSSFLRVIKSVVLGALLLPRLDACVLPTDFQSMDAGYMTFVGFTKLEHDHTHPVMLAFIGLLQTLARERQNKGHDGGGGGGSGVGDGGDDGKGAGGNKDQMTMSKRRRIVVFKWQTLYTLINNPDLRMDRKGYMQKIKLAKELGVDIPKSDTYVTINDDAILKARELRDEKGEGVVGKLTSAAGDKLEGLKDKMQKRFRGGSVNDETDGLSGVEEVVGEDGGEKADNYNNSSGGVGDKVKGAFKSVFAGNQTKRLVEEEDEVVVESSTPEGAIVEMDNIPSEASSKSGMKRRGMLKSGHVQGVENPNYNSRGDGED